MFYNQGQRVHSRCDWLCRCLHATGDDYASILCGLILSACKEPGSFCGLNLGECKEHRSFCGLNLGECKEHGSFCGLNLGEYKEHGSFCGLNLGECRVKYPIMGSHQLWAPMKKNVIM